MVAAQRGRAWSVSAKTALSRPRNRLAAIRRPPPGRQESADGPLPCRPRVPPSSMDGSTDKLANGMCELTLCGDLPKHASPGLVVLSFKARIVSSPLIDRTSGAVRRGLSFEWHVIGLQLNAQIIGQNYRPAIAMLLLMRQSPEDRAPDTPFAATGRRYLPCGSPGGCIFP